MASPESGLDPVGRKLYSINGLRLGHVSYALKKLGIKSPVGFNRNITPYSTDPAAFKAEMLALASDLEGVGL